MVGARIFFLFFLTLRVAGNIPTQSGSTFCSNKQCSGRCRVGIIYFHEGRGGRRLTAGLSARFYFCCVLFSDSNCVPLSWTRLWQSDKWGRRSAFVQCGGCRGGGLQTIQLRGHVLCFQKGASSSPPLTAITSISLIGFLLVCVCVFAPSPSPALPSPHPAGTIKLNYVVILHYVPVLLHGLSLNEWRSSALLR